MRTGKNYIFIAPPIKGWSSSYKLTNYVTQNGVGIAKVLFQTLCIQIIQIQMWIQLLESPIPPTAPSAAPLAQKILMPISQKRTLFNIAIQLQEYAIPLYPCCTRHKRMITLIMMMMMTTMMIRGSATQARSNESSILPTHQFWQLGLRPSTCQVVLICLLLFFYSICTYICWICTFALRKSVLDMLMYLKMLDFHLR